MRIALGKERSQSWTRTVKVMFWPALLTSGTAIGFLLTGMTRSLLGS
jgi:hypothetical protein